MRRFDQTMVGVRLLQISAVYLVVGIVMGLVMGVSSNFSLSSVHAHVLLLGWAGMAVTGIIYVVMPGCARSRLASIHFWGHNVGLPLMMASLALEAFGRKNIGPVIGMSSAVVIVSLVLFALNLLMNGKVERA